MHFLEFIEPIGQQSDLNPKLWQDQKLRPEVKDKLLKIAELFKEYLDIPIEVEDVIITGAQANLTYSNYSDLDLHLVVDFTKVDCDQELGELFDTKRRLFKREHNITIRGIPVEPGVEDLNNPTKGNAYSIINNKWITKNLTRSQYDQQQVEKLVNLWTNLINTAGKTNDLKLLKSLLKLLSKFRKWGLSRPNPEYSVANLVYKSLRNQGTIDKLRQTISNLEDQQISIKERT